jgi:hypothetical protein
MLRLVIEQHVLRLSCLSHLAAYIPSCPLIRLVICLGAKGKDFGSHLPPKEELAVLRDLRQI